MSINTEIMKRISVHVVGDVQGVGFRHFTLTQARRLGVEGWVRNEPDGSVRLQAEGEEDALEELIDAVKKGPCTARVESVNVNWETATDEFSAFRVRYI